MIRFDEDGREYKPHYTYKYSEVSPSIQAKMKEAMGFCAEGSQITFADLGAVIFNNDYADDCTVFWLEKPVGCKRMYYDDFSQYYKGADYECYAADPEQREFVPYDEAYSYTWDNLSEIFDGDEDAVEEFLKKAHGRTHEEYLGVKEEANG